MRPIATSRPAPAAAPSALPAELEAGVEVARPVVTAVKRWFRSIAPALGAVLVTLVLWELIVLTGWRPDYLLPGPRPVFARLWEEMQNGEVWTAVEITMGRAARGFVLAIVLGSALGFAM